MCVLIPRLSPPSNVSSRAISANCTLFVTLVSTEALGLASSFLGPASRLVGRKLADRLRQTQRRHSLTRKRRLRVCAHALGAAWQTRIAPRVHKTAVSSGERADSGPTVRFSTAELDTRLGGAFPLGSADPASVAAIHRPDVRGDGCRERRPQDPRAHARARREGVRYPALTRQLLETPQPPDSRLARGRSPSAYRPASDQLPRECQ
jgi:hypothetical protein